MSELLPITIFSLIMAGISQRLSKYDSIDRKYREKDKFFYVIMTIFMVLFVGLRTEYNDTFMYVQSYEAISQNLEINLMNIDWNLGFNPGFAFLNCVIKYLGFSSQEFLMFYAFITISIFLWFIRKYTSDIWLSIYLIFTTGVFVFSLAAIKQCVAIAFSLVATDCFLSKKYFGFVFWIIVAALFHPYALMFLLAPLMTFKPWTKRTYFYILIFGIISIFLQNMLGRIIDITSMIGENYEIDTFIGEGVNPLRVLVCSAPLFLSFLIKKELFKGYTSKVENLSINYTFLNAEIMFVGLFGTANYFGRLANYFLIFQCLSIPILLRFFNSKNRKILAFFIVVLYFIYFYYQYRIANGSFDSKFDNINVFDYISSLNVGN